VAVQPPVLVSVTLVTVSAFSRPLLVNWSIRPVGPDRPARLAVVVGRDGQRRLVHGQRTSSLLLSNSLGV
jgi:hypothetical protein